MSLEEIIKYWQVWGFGVLTAAIAALGKWTVSKIKRLKKEQEANNAGTLALLHDRLYKECKYHLDRGWCDTEERVNLEMLYTAYHDMGGNGTGTDLWNRVRALPFVEPFPPEIQEKLTK